MQSILRKLPIGLLANKIKYYPQQLIFRIGSFGKEPFECPICGYFGPFVDISPSTGLRRHAKCFRCGSLERHRLQKLVLDKIFEDYNPSAKRILHFAPEAFFEEYLRNLFKDYLSADLERNDVDVKCDMTSLPFMNDEFDFVYASHVLEHIQNDLQAISEVKRILKPDGIAILPVPIHSKTTVEYSEPNPMESFHVRSPGEDYYDRYQTFFSFVERFSSNRFADQYQPFVYEDRSVYPTKACPMRPSVMGEKHVDIVPVCFA